MEEFRAGRCKCVNRRDPEFALERFCGLRKSVSRFFLSVAISAAADCWRATLRRSSRRGRGPLHAMIGGALLATPSVDRPKGRSTTHREGVASSSSRFQTFSLFPPVARWLLRRSVALQRRAAAHGNSTGSGFRRLDNATLERAGRALPSDVSLFASWMDRSEKGPYSGVQN